MSQRKVRDEIHFLHVDQHQSFSQVDIIVPVGSSQTCPKTQNRKLVYFCNKKEMLQLLFVPF